MPLGSAASMSEEHVEGEGKRFDPAAQAEIERKFYSAAIDLMDSINRKLNFIVWVIVIAIILQILFGMRIL